MKAIGILYALLIGFFVWLVSYFLGDFIATLPELYLFPGIITGIVNGLLVVIVVNFYVKKYRVDNWFSETFLMGLIITALNFALEYIVSARFFQNTVLLGYPLLIIFSVFGGYLTTKKKD